MRLLGILNQIRILLEEQNDLLREIHLATRGTPALTAKRRPVDPTLPFRKRTASDVWIRPPLTEEAVAAQEKSVRESAASSVAGSDGQMSAPSMGDPEPTSDDGMNSTGERSSAATGSEPR